MAKAKYFALPVCSTCWSDPDMGEEFKEAKPNTPKCEDWDYHQCFQCGGPLDEHHKFAKISATDVLEP